MPALRRSHPIRTANLSANSLIPLAFEMYVSILKLLWPTKFSTGLSFPIFLVILPADIIFFSLSGLKAHKVYIWLGCNFLLERSKPSAEQTVFFVNAVVRERTDHQVLCWEWNHAYCLFWLPMSDLTTVHVCGLWNVAVCIILPYMASRIFLWLSLNDPEVSTFWATC